MIEILRPGALNTVQDLGRSGHRRSGVGTAGAMDRLALAAGNLLVGNARDAAGIEVQVFPFSLRFLETMDFALTGADTGARLDGLPLLPWWTRRATAGQVLTLQGARAGARSYLLLAGGVDVPLVLGSRSTQLRGQFGGHQGRALAAGDVLPRGTSRAGAGSAPESGFGIVPPAVALPGATLAAAQDSPATPVRAMPAAEYEDFDEAAHDAFWSADWKITAQSDRYGYRMAGPALRLRAPVEVRSHGIVPGVVQVPHNGQPIIQMRDAQPSGGYPKFGTVIEADLWRLGQAPAGSRIRFVRCSYEAALDALDEAQAYVDKVAHLATLYRQWRA